MHAPLKYKLVLFDFDGTLADSIDWFASAINLMADKYQFKPVQANYRELLRSYDTGRLLKSLGVKTWKLALIARELRAMMAKEIGKIGLFPGTHQMLQALSQRGAILGIVSSNSASNIRRVLGFELCSLIMHYECGVSIFGKAAKLRKVLRKARIAAPEAIYIGDELRDIEAARDVNVDAGAVSWGYSHLHSLQALKPAEVFTSMDQIVARLTAK